MRKFYILFLLMSIVSYTVSARLIINEVLSDPPVDLVGDANRDGARDATEAEFINFINNSATSLDVSDYKVYDFVLADTGSTGLSINNSGERIDVENAVGNIILTFDTYALSNNTDESYTCDPDVMGGFIHHEGIMLLLGHYFYQKRLSMS